MLVVVHEPAGDPDAYLAVTEVPEGFVGPAGPRGLKMGGDLGDDLPSSGPVGEAPGLGLVPQVDVHIPFPRERAVVPPVPHAAHLADVAFQAHGTDGVSADGLPITILVP
jgi:hypothetical protein